MRTKKHYVHLILAVIFGFLGFSQAWAFNFAGMRFHGFWEADYGWRLRNDSTKGTIIIY